MKKQLTRDEFETYVIGRTIHNWDYDKITFTDGSIIEIDRDDFFGDSFFLTTKAS